MKTTDISRRQAVKWTLLASGALVVGCKTPVGGSRVLDDQTPGATAAGGSRLLYIVVTPDDQVKFLLTRLEMGQGIMTGFAQMAGEELDVDPKEILVEFAGVGDLLPDEEAYDFSATGGSSSVSGGWEAVRKAAAAAREMLIAAAAADWGVGASDCTVENKKVLHKASGKQAAYGALATKAATLPVPTAPKLKEPGQFKYIGKPLPRLDIRKKVDGSAKFGIDVQMPGLVNATIVHCPYLGGKLKTVNDTAAKAEKGVTHVVTTPYGVAVVADTFWHASNGAKKLEIEWEKGPNPTQSSDTILTAWKGLVEQPGKKAAGTGNFAQAYQSAAKKVEAYYQAPYLPHSTLEPQNCTAWLKDDGTLEIWAPTQDAGSARDVAAAVAGVDKSKVKVHVTMAGGGFGRRLRQDYVAEAVHVAKVVKKPVKLLWSRAEEFTHDFYRPGTYNKLQAGLDASGKPTAFFHRVVGPSIWAWLDEAPSIKPQILGQVDKSMVEGTADLIYDVPNLSVEYTQHEADVPVSWWRSVGYSQNTWIVESFVDELAAAAGKDPLAFRLGLLKSNRHKQVLQLAADKAGWSTPAASGVARGIAMSDSFGTVVAEVVEVQVTDGDIKVLRVVAAVDCGTAVNPNLVKTQIQGAVVQALAATLKQEITVKDNMIVQRNFTACPLLTCGDTPDIEVHLVPSTAEPGGIGEPGVPPLAPALCNAVFKATGKRVRKLPIKLG